MCGIVGYIGPRDSLSVVVEGLRRMEYRGYDSAGVALISADGVLETAKKAGRIENLDKVLAERPPTGNVGMGHTRWATHGAPNDRNAHPHTDGANRLAVVHNGIIENFAALRAECEAAGVEFSSETDTEVVAHLLAAVLREPSVGLAEGLRRVSRRLQGAFTLVVVDSANPDVVVAARRNSPLVIGIGDGEMFLGSDVAAFIEYTRNAVEMGQDQVVEITRAGYAITTFDGEPVDGTHFRVDWDLAAAEKGGYEYFMLKEIEEQPAAVADTLRGHLTNGHITLDEKRLDDQELRDIDKVFIVACGSAYHAGLLAKYAIEHWTRIPVEVEMASEFRYRDPVLSRQTLVVAISQSGETADTLEAVRHAREQRAKVLAICNTNGAQIPRESDAVLYTHAGPEIGVAATKTFASQVAAVDLVALALAQARGTKYGDEIVREYEALCSTAALIEQTLECADVVRAVAGEIAGRDTVLFLGRHVGYPLALEGFSRGRAQARPDRADRRRVAGGRHHAVAGRAPAAAPEDAVEHGRGARAGRADDRHRRARRPCRRGRRQLRHRSAPGTDVALAAGRCGAAADPGRRDCARPRARRRQAAQPREVRHRRIVGLAARRERRLVARSACV